MRSGPAPPVSVYVHTLGCPKNEADSRVMVRSLLAAGARVVGDPDEATHILLNTCGFIQDAKEESIGAILDACASYAGKAVVVMGCLVERYRSELAKGIPEVAGWVGLVDEEATTEVLRLLGLGAERAGASGGPPRPRHDTDGVARGLDPRASYAYLKISDGCDEPCTFCAIPGIKGAYHSIPPGQALSEADDCLSEGARELVLVGQDTAIWQSGDLELAGLIDLLAVDARVRRIRVMYLQPEHVTDSFLRYMAGQPRLCRYLDIPFQHSHPDVLRRMGRWGDGDAYLGLLRRARRLMPDLAVRSTFIVGFPGEREEHFDHLLRFVEEAGFDYAGGFVYSPEEKTAAARLRPRVGQTVSRERLNRLSALLAAQAESKHQDMVGSPVHVMIDSLGGEDGDGITTAIGRTAGQAPEVDGVTYIEGDLPEGTVAGDIVRVTVSAALGYDLMATCDAS
jgi:ribosomal protein S12 methylthiotransferase